MAAGYDIYKYCRSLSVGLQKPDENTRFAERTPFTVSANFWTQEFRSHVPSLNLGSDSTPLGSPLKGLWEADGRNVSADSVTDATPRTTSLDSFAGINPNETWVLYMADLFKDSAGVARLDAWSLHVTQVPEPEAVMALSALGLLGFGAGRRFLGRR